MTFITVLHSNIEVEMDDQARHFSSQEFLSEADELLKREEQKEESFIFYPSGILFTAFDKTIKVQLDFKKEKFISFVRINNNEH